MKTTHHIRKRGSGKTTEIIELMKQNPDNCVLITNQKSTMFRVSDLMTYFRQQNNVIYVNDLERHHHPFKRYKTVYVDELLSFNRKQLVLFTEYIAMSNPIIEEIIAYSTPVKTFNKLMPMLCVLLSGKPTYGLNDIIDKLVDKGVFDNDYAKTILDELSMFRNYLLDTEVTNVIRSFVNDNDGRNEDNVKKMITKDEWDLSYGLKLLE